MPDYTALINNIARSEAAYHIYSEHPNYHHALHIFHANEKVYTCLNNLLEREVMTKERSTKVFDYLFHLEDWFLQFTTLEKEVESIEDSFSFDSLKNSIPYPSNFLESIRK